MKVLREKVQCRSSSSIHIDYSQPLVGGLSVHSTSTVLTARRQRTGTTVLRGRRERIGARGVMRARQCVLCGASVAASRRG
eukprot:1337363-Prymnesium_polylepis.2